jgi:hypothetical protein
MPMGTKQFDLFLFCCVDGFDSLFRAGRKMTNVYIVLCISGQSASQLKFGSQISEGRR